MIKVALAVVLAVLLASTTPAWADDWDGLGFLASMRRFDMDHFAPHPPGYPVYVAMLRVAALLLPSPMAAALGVAIACGVATVALVYDAAATQWGGERAAWVGLGVIAAPLMWRTASVVGSEAPALLFAVLGVWALARPRANGLVLGIAVGLGLGVRLSWAPIFLGLLVLAPQGARARAALGSALSIAAWLVPLVMKVGWTHLVSLLTTHLAGHTTRWGGTAITDPGAQRAVYLVRDVFSDGLGVDADALGVTTAVVMIMILAVAFGEWKNEGYPLLREVAIVLVPYLLWIAIGQNLRQQPRHALPIVVAFAAVLTLGCTAVTRARTMGVALLILLSLRTWSDAHARSTTAPAGAQLVEAVRALPHPERVAVFGGPSVRFFESTDLAARAFSAGNLGDVRLSLGGMNQLPTRVLVTSEIDGTADKHPPYPLVLFGTYCRPERIDRRAPCVTVYDLRAPFLPAQ